MLIGRPVHWVVEVEFGGETSQQQSEGQWERNLKKGERNVSGGLSFLFPLPPLSQLLILRPQVGREEGEGIFNMRVPTAAGRQTGAAIPGWPLVSGNHLYLLPRSQL